MSISKKLLAPLAFALILVGAGCQKSENPAVSNETLVIPEDVSGEEPAAPEAVMAKSAEVDATWQTYTNAALGFSFKWPTKGANAPRWEVTFPKDESLKDGCLAVDGAKTSSLKAGDTVFCHTAVEPKDGTAKDHYAARIGNANVVISFTKVAAAGFDWSAYRASLDGIVATFAKK